MDGWESTEKPEPGTGADAATPPRRTLLLAVLALSALPLLPVIAHVAAKMTSSSTSGGPAAGAAPTPTTGAVDFSAPAALAGWWKLDETSGTPAADSSGSGPAGTLSDGVTWSGGVAAFNGTSGSIATSGPVLNTSQSFTVSVWVRLTDNSTWRTAVSQDGAHSSAFQLQVANECGCWVFTLPRSDAVEPGQFGAYAEGPVAVGVWTHLVGVYNAGTATAVFYVNGAQAATVAAPTKQWSASGPLTIGRTQWNNKTSDFWAGDIDNVQVYSGALSAAEVSRLYTNGRTGDALATASVSPAP